MKRKALILLLVAVMVTAMILPAAAAPLAGPCIAGGSYDPACDVDRDNDVDIFDIQLTAGRWNTSGTWVADGWLLTGNAGTTPGVNFLGTTDNQALQLRVNNSRALLIQPNGNGSHNIVGGYSGNATTAGVYGATIGGGGDAANTNLVTDHLGTVGGGRHNQAGDADATLSDSQFATVGGGSDNLAASSGATVAGGIANEATAGNATVGGGSLNTAGGVEAIVGGGFNNSATGQGSSIAGGQNNIAQDSYAAVGGGIDNDAAGQRSTVAGGNNNQASGYISTVGGGGSNIASNQYATVPGGVSNTASGLYSFAAGQRAKAIHDGAFVWADSQASDWSSTAANTFRVRALNGAWFQANNATYAGIVDNDLDGDGLRAYTVASRGNSWAAAYVNNFGTSPGLVAQTSGTYAGYFNDQIFVTGGCTGCTLMYVALNAGATPLAAGDLVSASGVADALDGTTDPVLRVQQSGPAAQGVVGVVFSWAAVTPTEKEGETLDSIQAAEGAVQPGDYLLIVVQGLAKVKVAAGDAATPGQRLKASNSPGQARPLRTTVVNGITLDEGGPVVGVLLAAPDAVSGLAPVMVTLR